jgi:hypothetical protein
LAEKLQKSEAERQKSEAEREAERAQHRAEVRFLEQALREQSAQHRAE